MYSAHTQMVRPYPLTNAGRPNVGAEEMSERQMRPPPLNRDDRRRSQRGRRLPFDINPGLVKQVFRNLLSNAVKYMRRRGFAISEVDQTRGEGAPVLFIGDNGAGFNQQYADKRFGVFQRLQRAAVRFPPPPKHGRSPAEQCPG